MDSAERLFILSLGVFKTELPRVDLDTLGLHIATIDGIDFVWVAADEHNYWTDGEWQPYLKQIQDSNFVEKFESRHDLSKLTGKEKQTTEYIWYLEAKLRLTNGVRDSEAWVAYEHYEKFIKIATRLEF
jgi:hypothetical protein